MKDRIFLYLMAMLILLQISVTLIFISVKVGRIANSLEIIDSWPEEPVIEKHPNHSGN